MPTKKKPTKPKRESYKSANAANAARRQALRAKPIAGTTKRKKHNPERRAWRGRSHRKDGQPVVEIKATPIKVEASVELAPCFFCAKKVDKESMFCFGCKKIICDECDKSLDTGGHGHQPEAHLEEPRFTW